MRHKVSQKLACETHHHFRVTKFRPTGAMRHKVSQKLACETHHHFRVTKFRPTGAMRHKVSQKLACETHHHLHLHLKTKPWLGFLCEIWIFRGCLCSLVRNTVSSFVIKLWAFFESELVIFLREGGGGQCCRCT